MMKRNAVDLAVLQAEFNTGTNMGIFMIEPYNTDDFYYEDGRSREYENDASAHFYGSMVNWYSKTPGYENVCMRVTLL
jgi:hypothetical protein